MTDPSAHLPPVSSEGERGENLWRHGDFLKLWIGQTISLFGSRFTALAIQFVGAVTLQATPAQMGILAAVDTAPFLLVGLYAGVWVDCHRRRPILIAADLGRAILLATIPAAALADRLSLNQLYLVGFLVGVLDVFFGVAHQSYLPTLVERNQLLEGNSKLAVSRSTANIAGLGIAGVVIQAITAPLAIVLDAVSYLISALCVLLIRRREEPPAAIHESVLAQARAGVSVIVGNPLLRACAGCTATSNFTSMVFFALYILFGTRELGLGAAVLGLVYGIGVIGGVAGGLVASWAATRLGLGRAIVIAAFLGALEVLPAAYATRSLAVPLLLFSSVIGNFGWTVYGVNADSLRQAIVPISLQGRVNATLQFLVAGVLPLGGLLGGGLGQALGLREAIILAAFGSLFSVPWVLFSPVRELKGMPEAAAEPTAG